jgi:Skp family chaperone for outer membrane proteins
MKDWLRTAGVCLALGTLVLAGTSWSGTKPPAPRTRIAVFNLNYVMRYYDRFTKFQEELKRRAAPFLEKNAKLTGELDGVNKQLQDPATPAETREELERQARRLKRQIEENKEEADKDVHKVQGEQLKVLYADVQAAAVRHAEAHDLDMVLHYNDAVTKEEYLGHANVVRKMGQAGLMPLWWARGQDITLQIVEALNDDLRRRKDK